MGLFSELREQFGIVGPALPGAAVGSGATETPIHAQATSSAQTPKPGVSVRSATREAPVYLENVEVDTATTFVRSTEGEWLANHEQARLLCFLSDGRLLVVKGQEHNAHVMSYMTLLRRRNVEFELVFTTPRTIGNLYQRSGIAVREEVGGRRTSTAMEAAAAKFVSEATQVTASDIHICVDPNATEIYYRINGDLEKMHERDSEFGWKLVRYFYHGMADLSEDTFKENMRLDARIGDPRKLPEGLNGVRISTSPTVSGSLMVLRLLYADTSPMLDLCELGFAEEHRTMIDYMLNQPTGLTIISGPTGSGKSTTLQRALRGFISRTAGKKHVITVEDPPEYPILGARQTPVNNATSQAEREESFVAAISSAMRLDPDTLMIGEIRDLPSAELALRAATTGHNVLSTLHANNALAIADRLINIGLDRDMLLDHSVLNGLISQRLIKKLCPHCKRPLRDHIHEVDPRSLERIQRAMGADWVDIFITGDGCDHCRKGTLGRTVVAEMVIPDPQICEYLRRGERIKAREHWIREQGGRTLIQHTLEKVRSGHVDPFMAESVVGSLLLDNILADNMITVRELAGG